ncbi:MAG TPA: hypothetical protein VG796_08325 [Verrucomicrobiales bacterium]|nr:hypothetical protein [Verrucomicrobiales bacterium]
MACAPVTGFCQSIRAEEQKQAPASSAEAAKAALERLANDFQRHFLWAGRENLFRSLNREDPVLTKQMALLGERVMKVETEPASDKFFGIVKTRVIGRFDSVYSPGQQENTYRFVWLNRHWDLVSGTTEKNGKTANLFGAELLPLSDFDGTEHFRAALKSWTKFDADRMTQPDAAVQVAKSTAIRQKAASARSLREMYETLCENLTGEEMAGLLQGSTLDSCSVLKPVMLANASRVTPALAPLLRNPKSHRPVGTTQQIRDDSLAFIGYLLNAAPDSAALQALISLWPVDADKDRSQYLMQALAATGSREVIPIVIKALNSKDRNYLTGSVTFAISQEVYATVISPELASAVAAWAQSEKSSDVFPPTVFQLLAITAPEDAVRMVSRPSSSDLRQSSRTVALMTALFGQHVKVPRPMLLEWLAAREELDNAHPGAAGEISRIVLALLGDHSHPDDLKTLEEGLTSKDREISIGSFWGLARWHGLPEIRCDTFFDGTDDLRPGLPREARNACIAEYAAIGLRLAPLDKICERFSQLLLKEGVDALKEVGETELSDLMRNAIALTPPPDSTALDALNQKRDRLPRTYEDSILKYRIRHKEVFKSLKR